MTTVPLPVIGSGAGPIPEIAPRPTRRPRPDWLRVRVPSGPTWGRLRTLLREKNLHTVCEEARCPNVAECWGQGTATFMILGDICTRACRFCAVTTGRPVGLDLEEPERVADAVELMDLRHAVITSVNRDDLADGGAGIFAETIRAVRRRCPGTTVEVLIPDFQGDWAALAIVMEEDPEILNHNVETVPRLYKAVRPGARYRRSLDLLRRAKELRPGALTKTGVMLGLGETAEELDALMEDLVRNSVDILTAGQYLQPTPAHLPVERFVPPDEFRAVAERGRAMGLRHVEAGPLVRSSYHAANQIPDQADTVCGPAGPHADQRSAFQAGGAIRTSSPTHSAGLRPACRPEVGVPGRTRVPPGQRDPLS